MYSRSTHGRDFKIPEHYGGTFLRGEGNVKRDAVGRPSAISEKMQKESIQKRENIKRSPLASEQISEEWGISPLKIEKNDAPSLFSGTSIGSDELLIGAIILLLLGGREGGGEDSTLLILLLLLFI